MELQPFRFDDDHSVRVLGTPESPEFVAADVASALGYRMASDMTRRLDEDDRGTRSVRTPSGDQEMTVVTESGLYAAVLGSRVPRAKAFKRWITHTVLPEIRRTGSFGARPDVAQLPDRRELAQWVIEAENKAEREKAARIEAEARARELEAPASAWSHLADSTGDYGVADAAKVLSRDPAISIGRDRLFRFMAIEGWIFRNRESGAWKAYQTQIDNGRLTEKLGRPYLHEPTGQMRNPDPTVRVSAKGLAELHKRLGGSGQLPLIASA